MNMDWVALDPKHSNRTIHRAGVTRVMLTPTSLDWEAGQQVGMQQVTPDVPMHLSLTDDRQEEEFISSKPEMSREITRLREQLATVTGKLERLQTFVDSSQWHKENEQLREQLATAQAMLQTQREILLSLITVVGQMKVPQTMKDAALQILIVGPVLKRAQDFIAKEAQP